MQHLYLMVGYPGAGKTTVAQLLHELTGAVHIWTDAERHKMFADPTLSETESQTLYKHLNQKVEHYLATGQSVVFDANFNYQKDRAALQAIAAQYNTETTIIHLTTPKALALERAVSGSAEQPTRMFTVGSVTAASFNRVADRLEIPQPHEPVVELDGTNVTADSLKQLLRL